MKIKKRSVFNVLIGLIVIGCMFTFYTTFSMNNNYKFESKFYNIEDNYIKGISSNTSIELYSKYFDMDNCSIKVIDENNDMIENGFVFNGSKTILYDTNNNVIGEFINIIKGDINRDGMIDGNDFYDMGKCLVNDCSMEDYLFFSVDIDDDSKFMINDLILLDKAITFGYKGINIEQDNILLQSGELSRLVARVEPSYGVNFNVKWVSNDNGIVSVDDAGRVTGHNEGTTVVKAMTLDGKYEKEIVVKVDNTIQLDSYEGIGYVGGNDLVVGIKAVDYDDITCSVSNDDYASCEINNKKLILKLKSIGMTEVKVSSAKYGEVIYKLDVKSAYLNVMPKYICNTPGNVSFITVSGFNSGNLSFEYGDNDIIASAYMEKIQNRNMLRINFGSKQGRTYLKVKESNGNNSDTVVVDVYYMTLADIGKVAKIGEEVSTVINGDNLGELSCKTSDSTIGVCRIEDNKLIVTAIGVGNVTVDVYNRFVYESSL